MRTVRWVTLGALVLAALLTAGCGSDWWEDDWNGDWNEPSPWKSVHIYLNVADQDGNPLPGVTVWVAGEAQPEKTRDRYQHLGQGFPPDWVGWSYNWDGGPFWFNLRDGDDEIIEIRVSRSGYRSQRTTFRLEYWGPDEVYVRQTFVMERSVASAGIGTEEVVDAPQQPEVISAAQVTH